MSENKEDYDLTARQLADKYNPKGDDCDDGQHPVFSQWDWVQIVAQRSTRLGYWDWVVHRLEQVEYKL